MVSTTKIALALVGIAIIIAVIVWVIMRNRKGKPIHWVFTIIVAIIGIIIIGAAGIVP
jgi:RsiW-degrading membrane proteinase PrsW (M82 family)